MTIAERGQYLTLLWMQNERGRLSLEYIMAQLPQISAKVLKLFSVDEQARYYNAELEKAKTKSKHYSESRKKNAKKRWESNVENYVENYVENSPSDTYISTENANLPTKGRCICIKNDAYASVMDMHMHQKNDAYASNSPNNTLDIDISKELDYCLDTNKGIKTTTTTTIKTTTNNSNDSLNEGAGASENSEYEEDYGLTDEQREQLVGIFNKYCPASNVKDFIVYNYSRGWRGIGGEDVRSDFIRYALKWEKEEKVGRKDGLKVILS